MVDWITDTLAQTGYFGIVLLMFAENIFPPIPSELIMPFAGFVAARGDLNLVGVVIAGTFGSILGALPWYYAGRLLGRERLGRLADRHGRWLTVTRDEVENAIGWFDKHGAVAVLFGRLIPTIRTLISVPAGLARMNLAAFLAFSTIGTVVWSGLLAGAGYLLESQYEQVAEYIDPIAKGVVVFIVLAYLYRLVTHRPSAARRR